MRLNNKGQTLVEYVLIISLITVLAIAVVKIFGGYLKDSVTKMGCEIMNKEYVETEEMWSAQWDMKGAPWEKNNAAAQKTFAASPHLFVDKWDTPILCIRA